MYSDILIVIMAFPLPAPQQTGAALVTEQLGLEQAFGKGRAVDGDEGNA
jgi:hypothetical protein